MANTEELLSGDDLDRIEEIRADVLKRDPALIGLGEELRESLSHMRAMQLFRVEQDPDIVDRMKREDVRRMKHADFDRMVRWCFPVKMAKAIVSGKTEMGKTIVDTPPMKFLRESLDAELLVVAMVGLLGTGKTLAACAIAFERRVQTVYCTARQIWEWTYRKRDGWIERLTDVPLLIIDEVGHGDERKDEHSPKVAALVVERFDHDRPTIMLGNLLVEQFEERYPGALQSRMWQRGALEPFTGVMREGEQRRQDR